MRVGKKNDEKFLKINNALFGYSTEKKTDAIAHVYDENGLS
jgi:hypothetical protein